MCDSPSILIERKKKKIYLFNFCRNSVPPKDKEPFFEYNIKKIFFKNDEVRISGINEMSENITLTFKKIENDIYKIIINGDFPSDYIGGRVNSFFTSTPNNFQKEDCEDFEG